MKLPIQNIDLTIERYIAKHQHHLLDDQDEVRNYEEMLVEAKELIDTGDAGFNDRIHYLQAYGSVGLLICTSHNHPRHKDALKLFKVGKTDYLIHAINDFSHVQDKNSQQYKPMIILSGDTDKLKEQKVQSICQKMEIDLDILNDATTEELNTIANIPKRICAQSRLKMDFLNGMRDGGFDLTNDSRFLVKSGKMSYLSLLFDNQDIPCLRMN